MATKRKNIKVGEINKYGYQKTENGYVYVGKNGIRRAVAPVGFVNKNGYQKQADGTYKYMGKKAFQGHEDKPSFKRALDMIHDLPSNSELLTLSVPVLVEFKDKQGRKKEGFAIGYKREAGELITKVVGAKGEWNVNSANRMIS